MSATMGLNPEELDALRDEHREEKWSIDRDGLPAQLDSECFACCEPWPCDVARLIATYDAVAEAARQRSVKGDW